MKYQSKFTQEKFDQINNGSLSDSDWWRLVKTCVNNNGPDAIPVLHIQNDNGPSYVNGDVNKGNMLNDIFVSATDVNGHNSVFPSQSPRSDARLHSIAITPEKVSKSIQSIPSGKSPGPDHISPYVLKESSRSLTPILTEIYNLSLEYCFSFCMESCPCHPSTEKR